MWWWSGGEEEGTKSLSTTGEIGNKTGLQVMGNDLKSCDQRDVHGFRDKMKRKDLVISRST
jgi:hypothetical protein